MKKITTLAILSAAALILPACNENSSTEAIKEKADDAKKAIETNAEQAKDAASKKIDEAKEKAKAAAPAAAAAVDNMASSEADTLDAFRSRWSFSGSCMATEAVALQSTSPEGDVWPKIEE